MTDKLLPQYFNISTEIIRDNIAKLNRLEQKQRVEAAYNYDWHLFDKGGIETDDTKLKSITIGITNWERQYYIPYIFNMYYHQDYPKELLEFIVVDTDSEDKKGILDIVTQQAELYPEFKIRFFQHYIDDHTMMASRRNTVGRFANNELLVMNETDTLPINDNFLRGITYSLSLNDKIYAMPMGLYLGSDGNHFHKYLSVDSVFGNQIRPHWRIGQDFIIGMNTQTYKDMRGHEEGAFGCGGHEGNIVNRLILNGGYIHPNREIMSLQLINFPFDKPKGYVKLPMSGSFTTDYTTNDENWGTTKGMKEYCFNG